MTPEPRRYPHAERQDVVEEPHGLRVPDPYRQLEDAESPATLRWGAEQDALYEAERASWADLERWKAEVAAIDAVDRARSPEVRGGRVFWLRQDAGQEHPVLMVAEAGADTPERVLLDPSALDPSGRTVLDAWEPSVEGDLLAFQVSRNGTEDSLLRVLDVATGRIVDGPVDRVRRSSIGWLPGGEAYYYVRNLDPLLHPGEGRYHRRV
ncbi:prolyl oligopeptidase family serine peptidase, partial [Streptomyces goshikiensis]